MNEKELKALQDAIKNEQEKQTALIAEIKAGVDGQKGDYDKKFDEYAKNIQKLSEQADAIQLAMNDQKMGKKSPWEDMKKALTDPSVRAELKKGGQKTFELKASTIDEATELSNGTTDLSGAVIIPFRAPGVSATPDRRVMLLDLVTRGAINSNRVSWVERSARTEATAAVSEGNPYAQSDFTWIQKFAPVEKIGTFVKITNEALEDWDQVMSIIRNELFASVERKLEEGLYSGNGTSPQLVGIIQNAKAYDDTGLNGIIPGPNAMDAFIAAIMQLERDNFFPSAGLVNPADYAAMLLAKDSQNNYVVPPFAAANRLSIRGVPIYPTNLVTAGNLLVGDFSKSTLYIKRGIEIKIWDQDSTDPEYDLKTITASVRAVVKTASPDYYAYCYDAIADIKSAIEFVGA